MQQLHKELWYNIKDFEGLYEVSKTYKSYIWKYYE